MEKKKAIFTSRKFRNVSFQTENSLINSRYLKMTIENEHSNKISSENEFLNKSYSQNKQNKCPLDFRKVFPPLIAARFENKILKLNEFIDQKVEIETNPKYDEQDIPKLLKLFIAIKPFIKLNSTFEYKLHQLFKEDANFDAKKHDFIDKSHITYKKIQDIESNLKKCLFQVKSNIDKTSKNVEDYTEILFKSLFDTIESGKYENPKRAFLIEFIILNIISVFRLSFESFQEEMEILPQKLLSNKNKKQQESLLLIENLEKSLKDEKAKTYDLEKQVLKLTEQSDKFRKRSYDHLILYSKLSDQVMLASTFQQKFTNNEVMFLDIEKILYKDQTPEASFMMMKLNYIKDNNSQIAKYLKSFANLAKVENLEKFFNKKCDRCLRKPSIQNFCSSSNSGFT